MMCPDHVSRKCAACMHLQDREFLHVLKDADIETANESGAGYNSQARPCSYSCTAFFWFVRNL